MNAKIEKAFPSSLPAHLPSSSLPEAAAAAAAEAARERDVIYNHALEDTGSEADGQPVELIKHTSFML